METLQLPEDGSTTSAWGDELTLSHPKLKHSIVLKYSFEPPFGDPLFELYINGIKESEHQYWGRSIAISENGGFLSITRNLHGILTTVFDLNNMEKRDVTGFVNILGFDKGVLQFKPYLTNNETTHHMYEFVQEIHVSELGAWEKVKC
jgi:hypothetical protein